MHPPLDQNPDGGLRQGAGLDDLGAREGTQSIEQVRRCPRLSGSHADDHRDRQIANAPAEVVEEQEAGHVGPMGVVDDIAAGSPSARFAVSQYRP